MTDLTRIRLKTFGWFLCFPVLFIVAIPWWLTRRVDGQLVWRGGLWQWVGVWLILNGVGLAGWCVNLFNVKGRGTPVPFDPPKAFVVSGPYRFVRNPMMLGLFSLLLGETALYGSRVVLLYALGLMALAMAFVHLVEEPDLQRRFGASYLAYTRQVPRWLPRVTRSQP